jgi:hypothetical protein
MAFGAPTHRNLHGDGGFTWRGFRDNPSASVHERDGSTGCEDRRGSASDGLRYPVRGSANRSHRCSLELCDRHTKHPPLPDDSDSGGEAILKSDGLRYTSYFVEARYLRIAYAIQFVVRWMAVFAVWGQVGGQGRPGTSSC